MKFIIYLYFLIAKLQFCFVFSILSKKIEEAKTWISECIREDLPSAAEFEQTLPNGVYLAKVGHFCAPHVVPYDKIFDVDQDKWKATGLHFKHTENINYFLNAVKEIGLPEVYYIEKIYIRVSMYHFLQTNATPNT